MNTPETPSGGSLKPVGSASLEQLEERLRQQAESGDTEGFHATLGEIESLSAQDRTLLAILAVCLIGRPPNSSIMTNSVAPQPSFSRAKTK